MFCKDETGILGFHIIQKYMVRVHSFSQHISIHQTSTPSLSPAGANPSGHTAKGGTIPWTSQQKLKFNEIHNSVSIIDVCVYVLFLF